MTNTQNIQIPIFTKTGARGRPYPDPSTDLGKAWADMWAELISAPTMQLRRFGSPAGTLETFTPGFLNGKDLARWIAPKHGLQVVTLRGLLSVGCRHKVLESVQGVRREGAKVVPWLVGNTHSDGWYAVARSYVNHDETEG
jgi:hypothetical protein